MFDEQVSDVLDGSAGSTTSPAFGRVTGRAALALAVGVVSGAQSAPEIVGHAAGSDSLGAWDGGAGSLVHDYHPYVSWSSLGSDLGETGITNVGAATTQGDTVLNADAARSG